MSSSRRRKPIRRVDGGRIAIELPPGVRDFMVSAAQQLRETGGSPGSPGFERLYSPIDESAALDDPAYVLSLQLAVDELVSTVADSADKEIIDPEQAEAWVKVLGMTLSRRAAELGVRNEDDRAALGVQDEAVIRVVYALQVALIDAIDEADRA